MDPNETQQEEIKKHPAWKPILDKLPESLHSVVEPALKEWDRNVNSRFQEIHKQYEPYKELVENEVSMDLIRDSVKLLTTLNNDPETLIKQAIEAYDLEFVPKDELEELKAQMASEEIDDSEELGTDDMVDIRNDPFVKDLVSKFEDLNKKFETEEETRTREQQERQFKETMEALKTEHGEFNELFVTAMMSQGVDGEEAVKMYHDTINQAAGTIAGTAEQEQETPPVVMGGDSETGSGLPSEPARLGDMSDSDINKIVQDMIKADIDANS